MKWFDRWFINKFQWAKENAYTYNLELSSSKSPMLATAIECDDVDWGDGLNIRVKRVNGGFIINFRKYDRVKDRNQENIHIITDAMEFNQELGKLITLESMR